MSQSSEEKMLIEQALDAQEHFDIDELEDYANRWREKNAVQTQASELR